MHLSLSDAAIRFFQNVSVLIVGTVGYAWLRNALANAATVPRVLAEGSCGSLLAILCMVAPFTIAPGIQLDARNAIIALVAIFGGPLAGAITTASAVAYRLWLGGAGASGGTVGAIAAYALALLLANWLKQTKQDLRYKHLAFLAAAVAVSMLLALLVYPAAVAFLILEKGGLPGLTIVPGATFVLGAIVLLFERGRLAEEALAQSEARLRAIIDNLPQPLAIKDRQNRILRVNTAYERITEIPREQLIGADVSDIWQKSGLTGGGPLPELNDRVWRTGKPQTSAPLPVSIGDRHLMLAVSSFPICVAGGQFDAIGTITNDVTELVAAREESERQQAALQRHQKALTDFVHTNVFMEGSLTFKDAVRAITEAAGDVMGVEFSQVFLVDDGTGFSRCVDEWVRSARRHDRAPDVELSAYQHIISDLDREQVVPITDANDARLAARREIMRRRKIEGGIIAGVYLGRRMVGHVGFMQAGSKREWTTDELGFARSIADLVALMLMTTRYREALAALDLVSEAIYVEREDGRVIYANNAALALTGRSNLGQSDYGDKAAFPRVSVPLTQEHDLHQIRWTQNAIVKDLELHRSNLPGSGIATVIRDTTEKNAEQRDRERLERHLQQASKMEAIGQLASGIAHDFNNLLGAIGGFARFLEEDLPPDTAEHRFAQRISSAANRGRELVLQILGFTRARTLARRKIDIRKAIEESRNLLVGSLPPATEVRIDQGREPVIVEANASQIEQIVVNLCLNAHDAMNGRQGSITIASSKVEPGQAAEGGVAVAGQVDPGRPYARLDVSDTGCGIPPDALPRIFEPFFTTKERGRGTGLGLSVVHGILTTYGGACVVDSQPGIGSRFSIYLPLAQGEGTEEPDEHPAEEIHGSSRILIVDDEIDVTDMLTIGLERLGYETAAINDPREAIDVFAEAPHAWDAVVMDQLMPGMHGLALAENLKALRPEIVIVLCTGLDDGTIGEVAKAQGVDAFFAKPVTPTQLARAIQELLPR
jgi:signal transduction histidine kinase